LTAVILKFAIAQSAVRVAARHVTVPCDVAIATGNYLVIHMDLYTSVELTLDSEIQLCVVYS
jgi:hypothetical protein